MSVRRLGPLLLVLLVTVVWRLPSLLDPPWVNDEGTYFAVAQAMAHGYRLYSGIWENKPPAIYLLYSAVYHSFGPSLPGVRLLVLATALALVVLTYALTRRFAPRASRQAALFCGLLLGVPFLEGTTANAEIFLALCTASAVLAALHRRPLVAGLLMGIAVLFKAVAGFDMVALLLWLVAVDRSVTGRYVLGAAIAPVATVALAVRGGVAAAMVRDAVLYDVGYVGHGNGGVLPVAVKAALLAVLTLALLGRFRGRQGNDDSLPPAGYFPLLWLLWAAAGSLASGRIFGHYALQALVPLVLTLSVAAERRPTLLARAHIWLPAAFVGGAIVSAGAGWALAAIGHDSILARRLQYYANVVRLVSGRETYAAYRGQIDDHVDRNLALVRDLQRLPPGKLLIWGNTPWVYPLSNRLPATPYTSALRVPPVPGEMDALDRAVRRGVPVLIVVSPSQPALRVSLRDYKAAARVSDATIYVCDACRSVRSMPSARSGTR